MDGQKLSFNNFFWWAVIALIPVLILISKILAFLNHGNIIGYGFDWMIFAFFVFVIAIGPRTNLEIDRTGGKIRFTSVCLIYNKKVELDIQGIESVTMTKSYTRSGKHGGSILSAKVIVFKQRDGAETSIANIVDEAKGKKIAEFIGLPFAIENPIMPENADSLPYYDSFSAGVWQKINEKK